MTVIGVSEKIRIYIVRAEHSKPTNINQFIDYTSFFIKYKAEHFLNELAIFEGTAVGDMSFASPSGSGTCKDDLKRDNYIYILIGDSANALIEKFVITKPTYTSKFEVNIKAIQSSGSEAVRKSLVNRNTSKLKYSNDILTDLFTRITDPQGLLIDSTSLSIISIGTISDPTQRASLTTDNDTRITAVTKACEIIHREWIITHGVNSGTIPYDDGDRIQILNQVGNPAAAYTFHLTGSNQNAKYGSGSEEVETTANNIIVEGRDIHGNQIQLELYDGTVTKTYVTQTLDGWLKNDISATAMTFDLMSGHGLAGLGGIMVLIDNELIAGSVTGDTFTVTLRGASMYSDVTTNTVPASHKAGSDTLIVQQDSISYFGMSLIKIYVYDDTKVPAVDQFVVVGDENMKVKSKWPTIPAGQFYSQRFAVVGTWARPYAHSAPGGIGSDVFSFFYTPDNPESGSSIYVNGLHTETFTDNTCYNKDMLERKAKYLLNAKKDPVEKIALSVTDPFIVWPYLVYNNMTLGSLVGIQDIGSINIVPGDYRVVGYEISGPDLELIYYINDPAVRGYISGKTDFAIEIDDAEAVKQQDPLRSSDDLRNEFSTTAGNPLGQYSSGPTALQNVVVPKSAWGAINPSTWLTNDYDSAAANVGFVRAKVSAAGGYWTVVGGDLRPIASYDIESYGGIGSNESIGTSARPWDYGYFGQAICTSSCWVGGWRLIDVLGDFLVQYISGPLTFMTYRPQTGGSIPNQIRCDVIFKNYSATSDVAGLSAGHEGLAYFNTVTNKLRIYNGASWADVGGGASLWETSGTGIRPITSNDDVLPNGVANLGTGIAIWSGMYIRGNIQSAADVYIYMTTTGIAINRIRDGSGYGITFDTSSNEPAWRMYGASQNLVLTRLAGTGWIYLDAITSISGDCQPTTTLVYSLGDPAYIWKNFHISRIYMYDLALITTTQPLTITSGSGDTIITAYAGISLNLTTSGGIICGSNVSTFRPNVSITTDLGMSSFYWRYGYIQKVMCTQDSGARMRIPVGDSMYG